MLLVFIICYLLSPIQVVPYRYYTALNSIVFTNIEEESDSIHSEYFFGKCAITQKKLVEHDHMTYADFGGKLIVRRWINSTVLPNCAYVRANSSYADLVRYHAFKFGMCLCELIYVHYGMQYTYFYYEWYIPVEMMRRIEWDLYFYIA